MKRIVSGDIFEVEVGSKYAYLQLVCKNNLKMDIVRILQGLHSTRPSDFERLSKEKEQFFIEFVIRHAVKLGILQWVSNVSVAEVSIPRYYRTKPLSPSHKGWEIVDSLTYQRRYVEELSKEEIMLSPWGFWNDTLLKERLAAGWKLEDWV